MESLEQLLAPLRRRIFMDIALRIGVWGGCASLALAAFVQMAAGFAMLENSLVLSLAIIAAAPMAAIVGAFAFSPSFKRTIQIGDSIGGMQQRLITCYEIMDREGDAGLCAVSRLVVDDALMALRRTELARLYRPASLRRPLGCMAGCVGLLAAAVAMPPMDTPAWFEERAAEAAARQEFFGIIEANARQLQETADLAMELAGEDAAGEIGRLTQELLGELENVGSLGEAIRHVHAAQEQIERLADNSVNRDLRDIGRRLQSHPSMQHIGAALERGNFAVIEQELQELGAFLEQADAEARIAVAEELAEAARELAGQLAHNPELSGLLGEFSDAIRQGGGGLYEAQAGLSRELERLAMENRELREALEQLARAMEDIVPGGQGEAGQPSEAGGEVGNGMGAGSAAIPGDDFAGGSPNGSGEGGGVPGTGRGFGHLEGTNIYTRGALYQGGFNTHIPGIQDEQGEAQTQEVQFFGEVGEIRPASEVLVEYLQAQLRQLESADVPFGLRGLVEEYFSSLQ